MIPSLNDQENIVSDHEDGVSSRAVIEETLAHGWQSSLPDSDLATQNSRWLNIDSGLFTLCYETSNPNNGASSPFPRIRVL